MTNKEFDKWLRDSLSSVRPEPDPQDWEHFVDRVEESESLLDSGFDESIRDAMAGFDAGLTPDWDKMEGLLRTDEQLFDQHVKDTVQNLEVPYNPASWPTLHARIAEEEKLRQRLMYAKVLEVAAIFILFMTFYNFFPALKSSVLHSGEYMVSTDTDEISSDGVASATVLPEDISVPGADNESQVANATPDPLASQLDFISPVVVDKNPVMAALQSNQVGVRLNTQETGSPATASENTLLAERMEIRTSVPDLQYLPRSIITPPGDLTGTEIGVLSRTRDAYPFSAMTAISPVLKKSSHTRFGIITAADVNTLFMPEENFYSQGRYINFSEKEIVAGGYSAGASLLFDFKHVMIETGLMYSSKSFRPDRNLFIGSSLDKHTLDFENITLNVLGVPLFAHWKIDGKGLWRLYATTGISLHVIANAHYDLIAENPFTSSAVQDPMQVQNKSEVQRVREHMLDGAKFSSKGYMSAAGGFGVERYLNSRMSLFIQPLYEYQIPVFGLSEQNGKRQQNGSILLGTRISL